MRVVLQERNWVETSAEILESNVESFLDSKSQRMFRAVYLLRYKADRDVREALVRSAKAQDSRDVAAAKIAARPPGSRCLIHYDPHAPSQVNPTLPTGRECFARSAGMALTALSVGVLAVTLWFVAQGPEW